MFRKKNEDLVWDAALHSAYSRLATFDAESKEYAQIINQLSKLHEMKAQEKPRRVSPDTLAMIGANLTGILIIVAYENAHVVASKALGFIPRTL